MANTYLVERFCAVFAALIMVVFLTSTQAMAQSCENACGDQHHLCLDDCTAHSPHNICVPLCRADRARCLEACNNPIPHAPENVTLVEREATSIELRWRDRADNEDGYQLLRRVGTSGPWSIQASWEPLSGTTTYTDTGLLPDTLYCYRVRAFNRNGGNNSLSRCAFTKDGNGYAVWRAQIIFHTANVSNANTDDKIYVNLNGYANAVPRNNSTWLDYGRNDFERGTTYAYDLNLDYLGEIGDINQINISKTGDDGWCIQDFTLQVNGLDLFTQDFSDLSGGCLWLDSGSGHSRTHIVSHGALRAHPDWNSYNHTGAKLLLANNGIQNEEMVSRLEGMVGDDIHDNKLYWGHLHGPAVEVSYGCPAGAASCQTLHIDLDLAASAPGPNSEVDVDFDLTFSCDNRQLLITSSNVEIDADSNWFWEILSLGLINFIDNAVEERIEKGWKAITEVIEVGADCRISVDTEGNLLIEEGESFNRARNLPKLDLKIR